MNCLGIADGHTATACLLRDGVLVGMVSEERFNRKKGWGGVPARSIHWLLESSGLSGADIDAVAVTGLVPPVLDLGTADDSVLRKGIRAATRLAPASALASDWMLKRYLAVGTGQRDFRALDAVLRDAGIDPAKRHVVEHHTAHAATAYYPSPYFAPDEKMLIITVDGSGDGICASVAIAEQFRMKRIHAISSYHSIGDFYMRLTQHLGMKPLEHEYKVMGLAPYAPEEWTRKAYDIMRGFYALTPDGLGFENRMGRWGSDVIGLLDERLHGHRFDCVAAAGQRLVEDIVVPFVRNWILKTGIRTIGCAGGVFMNVKMNMLIEALPEVERVFFMPSGGDESTPYGAAWHTYAELTLASGGTPRTEPLGTLYLGSQHTDADVLTALRAHESSLEWTEPSDMADTAASLLAQNRILARTSGRMEFGARSLGNRTILANPSDPRNVRTINRAIKMRDFWMPFCPSVLYERRHDYTVNPRDNPARYMITAFPSTPLAFDELVCGLHPFDLTCRPQFVTRDDNPDFHAILKAFERRTGIGGVLNTSFNLHGEPIVESPTDAISTLLRSEIDYLILNRYLVWKRGSAAALANPPGARTPNA